jgi:hypothetical protein
MRPLHIAFALAATPALAEADLTPPAEEQRALDILTRSVDFRSVEGDKSIGAYADYIAGLLLKGGFAKGDVIVDRSGAAPTLIAVYRGTTDAAPLILSGHMDVVAADPADWTRDPFKAVVENGFVYGRGSVDNKFDNSMIVATLLRLKAEGFKPRRDVVLALSGDEETQMVTTEALAKRLTATAAAGRCVRMVRRSSTRCKRRKRPTPTTKSPSPIPAATRAGLRRKTQFIAWPAPSIALRITTFRSWRATRRGSFSVSRER